MCSNKELFKNCLMLMVQTIVYQTVLYYWHSPHGLCNSQASICPIIHSLHAAAAGLLLGTQQTGDNNHLLCCSQHSAAAAAGSVTFTADIG